MQLTDAGADLGILRGGGGLGSRSAGIFIYMYWQAKKKNLLGGVNPPPPPAVPASGMHANLNKAKVTV